MAAVGSTAAVDLGLANAAAAGEPAPERLSFGELEGLVALMQETPADRIVPAVIAEWKRGTDPKRLVAAAALANARTFGGEDYVGFHTMMALAPAFHMASRAARGTPALPIVKVIYRNYAADSGERRAPARSPSSGRAGRDLARPIRRRKPPRSRPGQGHGPRPSGPSPHWPRRALKRRSMTCCSPFRTTPRSTAPSSPTAPGTCSS